MTWRGYFAGEFIEEAQGDGGFGYDPHVWIPDCQCTVAQMPNDEKHRRSHRGQALRACVEWLQTHRNALGHVMRSHLSAVFLVLISFSPF